MLNRAEDATKLRFESSALYLTLNEALKGCKDNIKQLRRTLVRAENTGTRAGIYRQYVSLLKITIEYKEVHKDTSCRNTKKTKHENK